MFLGDFKEVSRILRDLVSGPEENQIIAYQIAFDLQDRAPQSFLTELRALLPQPSQTNASAATSMEEVDDEGDKAQKMQTGSNFEKLHSILSGQVTISLYVDFLYRHNKTDVKILQNIKASFERNSILHSATITANGIMHAGTTVDQFLRDNLDWLGKASNWAKFSATASLGVIHKGQIKDSLSILKPYLPAQQAANNRQPSVYSEGGALYALGIIHSNHGDNMTDYLYNVVQKDKTHHVIQHGACLGLGLSAMATGKEGMWLVFKIDYILLTCLFFRVI